MKKILNYLIAFTVILFLNFLLPRLMPSEPIAAIYGEEALVQMTPELKAELTERFALDKPLWRQFATYITSLLKGDLGYSFYQNTSVLKTILKHLPWTLFLLGSSLTISTLLGIIFGIESGWRRGNKIDKTLLTGMMILTGFPSFFIGIILLLIFSVSLAVLPLQGGKTAYSGYTGIRLLLDILKHSLLPLFSLILVEISGAYLLTRNSMITTLRKPYILTAKAKGLSDRKIRYKHAGRNAMLPIVTRTGIRLGTIVTGALFIEIVFSYPGVGVLLYNSLSTRDYPIIQGTLFVVAVFVLGANFAVDMLYSKLDPRVRTEGGKA